MNTGTYIYQDGKIVKISEDIPCLKYKIYGFKPYIDYTLDEDPIYIRSETYLRKELKKRGLRLKEPGEKDIRKRRKK